VTGSTRLAVQSTAIRKRLCHRQPVSHTVSRVYGSIEPLHSCCKSIINTLLCVRKCESGRYFSAVASERCTSVTLRNQAVTGSIEPSIGMTRADVGLPKPVIGHLRKQIKLSSFHTRWQHFDSKLPAKPPRSSAPSSPRIVARSPCFVAHLLSQE